MATPSQIAANILNSKKSTGPKTDAGKAKSSLNHLSHGFASSTAKLIDGEDPEELKALLDDLLGQYQPANPTEQILVEKMAQNQWLSQRAFRLQSDVLTVRIHLTMTIPHDLGLFIRYQTAADRAFHTAHTELVKAQKEREKSEIGFELQNSVHPAPPPAEPETERKTTPITCIKTDFPAEPAASVAPDAQPATEITLEIPDLTIDFLKNAA